MKIRILTGFSIALFVLLALVFLPHIAVCTIYLVVCGFALYEMMTGLHWRYSQVACDHCITEFIFICFSTVAVTLVFSNYMMGYIIVICAAADTAGFTVGKALGKRAHKVSFLKKVSPNKSWEGYIGGVFFSIGIGFAFFTLFKDKLPENAFWFAFFAWLPAIIGDLYESAIKRLLGLKDSADAIWASEQKVMQVFEKPIKSHGGYLDRIDSFIFVSVSYVIFNSIMPQ